MISFVRFFLLGISVFVCVSLSSQSVGLFDQAELMEMNLRAEWDTFLMDRSDTADYHRASLSFIFGEGQQVLPVKIRVRGNFRRREDICGFPPIRLKIKKKVAKETIFAGSTRLKLVTHCQDEVLVLKEYLVYKLYQTMFGEGFRVRLAKVHYVEKSNNQMRETRFAFFIESEEMLGKRLQGQILEDTVALQELNRKALTQLMVFQYMVGNTDWSALMSKNIRLLRREDQSGLRPIPYDFDWSGLVGAPYTGLDEDFDYRCVPPFCRTVEEYEEVRALLLSKEREVYALIRNFPYLEWEQARPMLQYLKKSYRLIKKSGTINGIFQDPCQEGK
ncbi:MAG: hypothetical protein AAF587_23780 [Bacteroidota bacterium]